MKAKYFALAAASLVLLATPVLAKDYPKGGVTADEIAADLRGIKHKAEITKDNAGDPMINASFDINGTDINYKIFFYGCENSRCKSIQYHVAFDGDAKLVSKWNQEHRFARGYITGTNLVHLEYDVDVEDGANSKAIQNATQRFKAVMVDGVKFWSN